MKCLRPFRTKNERPNFDGVRNRKPRPIRSQSTLLKYREKIEYVKVKVEINTRHALLSDSENGDCWKTP